MKKILFLVLTVLGITNLKSQTSTFDHYETAVFDNDIWKYHVGNSAPDANWLELSFNDSAWVEGQGGFGFGDNDDSTIIEQTISVFIRKTFNVPDSTKLVSAVLNVDYDDGFVAYINGNEVARNNVTGDFPAYNQGASANHEALMYTGNAPEGFAINAIDLKNCIRQGDNVIAVQVHNRNATSTDLTARVFLTFAITDTTKYFRVLPDWFVEPFVFASSNLPLVIIETENGQNIGDEPKTNANMKIIYNGIDNRNNVTDQGNIYDGSIGIEIRGSYSAGLPQKPYGFETRDSTGLNNNVQLLSLPPENDWILLANYNDKVFMRNSLAFHLFREMGHWAPRTEFCEVMLNNSYDGIYILTEKIKRDNDRVDIARLDPDDNAGDSLTGGYIFKTDYFNNNDSWVSNYSPPYNPGSQVYFVYHDPGPDELTVQQKQYIKDFIDAFETNLYGNNWNHPILGYRSYINVNSFVDYFIIGEVSRNVDAYKKSRFLFKDRDKNGGLLNSGPVWDFDWAWKDLRDGCTYFNSTDGSNWAYKINECNPWPMPPGWIIKLMEDTNFVNQVYTRYCNLRKTILSEEYLYHYIDSIHTLIDEAQARHYTRWPILGRAVGAPENATQPDTYEGEIEKFKSWIDRRITWLDANMPGRYDTSQINPNVPVNPGNPGDQDNIFISQEVVFRMFPNPASSEVYIESNQVIEKLEIYNLSGNLIWCNTGHKSYTYRINLEGFDPGLYITRVVLRNGKSISGKLRIE